MSIPDRPFPDTNGCATAFVYILAAWLAIAVIISIVRAIL